jgi:hypothetical protein
VEDPPTAPSKSGDCEFLDGGEQEDRAEQDANRRDRLEIEPKNHDGNDEPGDTKDEERPPLVPQIR